MRYNNECIVYCSYNKLPLIYSVEQIRISDYIQRSLTVVGELVLQYLPGMD